MEPHLVDVAVLLEHEGPRRRREGDGAGARGGEEAHAVVLVHVVLAVVEAEVLELAGRLGEVLEAPGGSCGAGVGRW